MHLKVFSAIVLLFFCTAPTLWGKSENVAILIGVTNYDSNDFDDDEGNLRVGNDVAVLEARLKDGCKPAFQVISLRVISVR